MSGTSKDFVHGKNGRTIFLDLMDRFLLTCRRLRLYIYFSTGFYNSF